VWAQATSATSGTDRFLVTYCTDEAAQACTNTAQDKQQ